MRMTDRAGTSELGDDVGKATAGRNQILRV
jgi:hypothetical protein